MTNFIWVVTLIVMLSSLSSCQKRNHSFDDSHLKKTVNENVLNWLDEQKVLEKPIASANIDLLKIYLDFPNIQIDPSDGNEQIIVIPVKNGLNQKKNIDHDALINLVLIEDKNKNIRKGNLVIFYSDHQFNFIPKHTFSNILNTGNLQCDGKFKYLSVSGHSLYELEYNNGKLKSYGKFGPYNSDQNSSNRIASCIDWYLVTTYYDVNGVEIYQTEQYIGTSCTGQECDPFLPCGGGGGGATGDPETSEEFAVAKTVNWEVAANPVYPSGHIVSLERIKGKRVASEPQGGHFKSMFHYESVCNFCNVYENPYNVWSESSCSVSASGQTASSTISGNLTYNGVGYLMSNSKTWSFQQLFP